MQYKFGEGVRALKLATLAQEAHFDSESQNIICNNNDILRKKKKFYKDLYTNRRFLFPEDNDNNNGNETEEKSNINREFSKKSKKKKIDEIKVIASKSFLNNPKKNNHNLVKVDNKIYVLQK